MDRTERVELTVLCLIRDGERYLLQARAKGDWTGFTLPGGHVEPGESIVDAVVREMKEETGLTIEHPQLCGVKETISAMIPFRHFSMKLARRSSARDLSVET